MTERLVRHWNDDSRKRKPRRAGFEIQEALGAEAIGGERVRGSGCSQRPDRKGDAISEVFRLSGKTTGKLSATVKREWWEEIKAQAEATGHVPVLMIGWDATSTTTRRDLLAFDRQTAKNMQRALMLLLAGNVKEALAYAQIAVGKT